MRKITLMMAALVMAVVTMANGLTSNIQVGMSGTYKVGTTELSPGFTSLSAAVTALNTNGVAGDVVLEITSDLTETGGIRLLVATMGSSTITIKPTATLTPTITFTACVTTAGATAYSGFGLDNTNNVIIDGSNTLNGVTKDLTFKMNDVTNGRTLIQLFGNCDNISIKNLNVIYQAPMNTASSTRGIYLNGQSTGACDNFLVENCTIGDATNTPYYAVSITGYGTAPTVYSTNNIVKNNILFGRIRPVYLYFVGSTGTTNEVSDNTISTIGGANATTTYTIMWNTWAGTFNIKNNKIPTLTVANTSGTSGVYGISGLSAATGSVVNMYNNSIGGINLSHGAAVPSVFSLMYIQDAATYNIYNNTFLYQSMLNATERSNIHISGTGCNVNLKNNIIVNYTDAVNAYCIWKSNGTLISDYNDLYVSGATANIGYVGGAAKQTLAAWQTGFTPNNDLNTKSVNVNFSSSFAGDLSLTGASIGDWQLAVPKQATVLTDIDGATRANLTYVGADEATTDLTTVAKQFKVTVPKGTSNVYVAGSFTGKNWDITDPFTLKATGSANEFGAILPCVDGIGYKYLCEKGDWDYQEAAFDGANPPLEGTNRSYSTSDNVPIWFRVNKITLNATFATAVPNTLFVKGSFDSWAAGHEMTKNGSAYSIVIGGNAGDKYPANTEYKYYTNDMNADNWESTNDGSNRDNRWAIAPVMDDEIARFVTAIPQTGVDEILVSARIMRTSSGIEVMLDGEASIELYSINGALLDKTVVNSNYSKALNSGIYIIRVNGVSTKFVK